MSENALPLEIEAKFYLRDIAALEARLRSMGAKCILPRRHEYNLRFDTPDGALRTRHQVLRLRQSDGVRLTYKGKSEEIEGARRRVEIEVLLDDFENARHLLEALGYRVTTVYEKYRAIYALRGAHIMLDELPYGNFAEIEGDSPAEIRKLCTLLHLDMDAAIPRGYLSLFETLCKRYPLSPETQTFDAMKTLHITAEDLGIRPADEEEIG